MPPFQEDHLDQKAVLWELVTFDESNEPIVSPAVEIDCRWVKQSRQGSNSQGTNTNTSATVIVNREIAEGSILWEGKLVDRPDPIPNNDPLMEVISYSETPDLRDIEHRREVTVARYRASLPAIQA